MGQIKLDVAEPVGGHQVACVNPAALSDGTDHREVYVICEPFPAARADPFLSINDAVA